MEATHEELRPDGYEEAVKRKRKRERVLMLSYLETRATEADGIEVEPMMEAHWHDDFFESPGNPF